ncbi:MAG: SIR2 family protein [Saprospirales bacterium]|nr:SIR2 family protein [Saprospirales bacterium]
MEVNIRLDESEEVVLLCGAGASTFLGGLPTLDDLVQLASFGTGDVAHRILSTVRSIGSAQDRYGKAVFEELIVKLREYLHLAQVLQHDHNFRNTVGQIPSSVENGEVQRKWKEALTKCYRVLLDEYGPQKINFETKECSTVLQLFEDLAKINNGKLHIYTTNYDCSYQVLAARSGNVGFYTHIDNNTGVFSENWFRANPYLENAGLPSIYIHRLHGCVAWFNINTGESWEGGTTIQEIFGAGGNLEIKNDDELPNMCIKLIASQLVGSNLAFSKAFEEFAHHLRTVRNLLVWGYSFRDLEVLRLINHTLSGRTEPLNIYYLDLYLPESTAIQNIRRTLLSSPIHRVAKGFEPKKINWVPADGYANIIDLILNAIKKQ